MNSSRTRNHRFLTLYFQVHQPRRLHSFRFFDIGSGRPYFDDALNREILHRVSTSCYLPANFMLLRMIRQHPEIKITFSISGVLLDQLENYEPVVLDSFRKLAATGAVEFLAETYYHSLASITSREEFILQVRQHHEKINELLGVTPTVFRNTELIYSDEIGRMAKRLGYAGVFIDGIEQIIHKANQNVLYQHPDKNGPKLILRNYRLSDDIAFRFSEQTWKDWPLTSKKYLDWLEKIPGHKPLITLGMDYETFGEHQKADSGIFAFMKSLLFRIAKSDTITMVTPSEAISLLEPAHKLSVAHPISWADRERDLSAWLGNDMQRDAFETLNRLERSVKKIGDPSLLATWRYLQTSDHLYYMSTKKNDDGRVHTYFSPYPSPYEAFMNYMNIVTDLTLQVDMRKKYLSVKRKSDLGNPARAV